MIYLFNFKIKYIFILLHISTLMSHLQAYISRPIVHIVIKFLCLTVFCRNIAIGIPIAIVLEKNVRHKNCKIICKIGLEMFA